ncbi:MAG TPA: FAD-binding protein [Hyphomicrobiaceae bacterium]|nr:FAD-binding protein [Hyphomicrobiaceae bacterium]
MTLDRRELLRAGVTGTMALAAQANALTPAKAGPKAGPKAGACEATSANVALSCDARDLDAAADDFGHIIHKHPHAVLKPRSIADIVHLMPWAGSQGLQVAARGQGHSTFGRAMTEGGVVVDMGALSAIHPVQSDRIVVEAGATWSSVVEATLPHGLTPPVLTNYLELSIGGTLAVGGIGGTTSRYGMQTDNVLALTVVTGDGRELTCSASSNADLFDAVRAGLGQCGVITEVTLRLMPAPARVRRYHLFYPNLKALTAAQHIALADERFDLLQGALLPDGAGAWRYQLEGVVFYDTPASPDDQTLLAGLSQHRGAAVISDLSYLEEVKAFARLETLLRSNGQWFNPHPWFLAFLPGSNAVPLVSEVLEGLSPAEIGPLGRITFYPIRTTSVHTPLVRLPMETVVFPFNLIRMPPSNAGANTQQMLANNRRLYERIRSSGGLQYPVGTVAMSREDWKDHFGPQWQPLADAKRRYDPRTMLAPGYNLF